MLTCYTVAPFPLFSPFVLIPLAFPKNNIPPHPKIAPPPPPPPFPSHAQVWNHREHAIKAVAGELPRCYQQADIGARMMYRVLIPLLRRLLTDKVPQVRIPLHEISHLHILFFISSI